MKNKEVVTPRKRIAIFIARHTEVSNDVSRNFQMIGKRWAIGNIVYDQPTIDRLLEIKAPIEIYFKEREKQPVEENAYRPAEGGHP